MYCFKCGKEIPEESVFCPHCGVRILAGNSVVNSKVEESTGDQKVTLTIDRKSQPYLINPPVKVVIDNTIRFGVDNGKSEKIVILPGHHIIEFKMSTRSKRLEVDLQADMVIEIGFSRLSGAITATIV